MPRLTKLTLMNFMSVRSATVTLEKQGLVLLQGKNLDAPEFESNGAGKSSFFEAITYAIHEKSLRGLTPNELVNKGVGKNMSVFLDLVGDDGKQYRISRFRKHKEHKNNTYIYQDGVNITPKSSKDSNLLIEEIVGMDFTTFSNSILFGGGLIKTFSVASDAEKKSILENILQLDVWSKALDVSKRKLVNAKKDLDKLVSERDILESRLETGKSDCEVLREKQENFKIRKLAELAEKKVELKELKGTFVKELSDINSELELKTAELEAKNSESLKDRARLPELKEELAKIDAVVTKVSNLERYVYSLEVEIDRGKKDLKKLKTSLEELDNRMETTGVAKSLCEECGQELTDDHIEEHKKRLKKRRDQYEKSVAELKEELVAKSKERKKLSSKLDKFAKVSEKRSHVKDEISEITSFIRVEAREKDLLESEIKRLRKRKAELGEMKDLKRLKKEIKRIKNQEDEFSSIIEEKEKEIATITERLSEIQTEIKSVKSEINNLEFAVQAFGNGGIKSYLLDSVTPYLNKKANEYLGKLSGNTSEINFSTRTTLKSGESREKFEVAIVNKVGGESYKANSTGEKRRFDLAISLALQDLIMSRSSANFNLLMYDEIFDGLDTVGCENAVQLLHDIQDNFESIFVITHNDVLKSYFDNQLVVTKTNGETSMELNV